MYPRPVAGEGLIPLAIRESRIVHIPDVEAVSGPSRLARLLGFRSQIVVPMLREGAPIGVLSITREEAGLFPDPQVELLRTFADQAVIAIENVRLFRELERRNADLTEALEQQTATSEILRVISSSPTDVQPVFDAIARSALQLCRAAGCVVTRFDGERLHVAAVQTPVTEFVAFFRTRFPMVPDRSTGAGRAVLDGTVVHISEHPRRHRVRRSREYAGGLSPEAS